MKFFTAIFCSLAIFGGGLVSAAEQIGLYTDKKIIPPDYDSFHPPLSVGSTYSDPVFGTRVTRMTNSSRFNDEVVGGYFSNAEICYFNKDGFYFLAIENEWDGDNYPLTTFLYNGLTGERIKLLGRDHIRPYQIRWALAKQYTVNGVTVTMDPNYHFYNYVGNEIRLYDVRSMNDYVVLRKFDEYSEIGPSGGEGDLSDDGRYWVLDGDAKEMFVYDLIKDVKHPVSTFDLGSLGSKSGSVGVDYATISARGDYIIVAWGTDPGIGRYRGIEVYDKNWNFQRQIYPGIIHWETGVDAYGEQVVYCAGTTSYPEFDALDGISTGDFISIRLRDGYVRLLKDVPIWSHYSMSACNSVNGGDYLYVSLTSTRTDDPYELWAPFWGEILEIPTDGSGQVRRLLHHRSRPVQGRTGKFATPDAVINRQGNRIVFRSTYNTSYGDLFMFEIPARQQSSDPDDIPPLKPDDLQGYQDNSNTIRLEWTTPDAARDGDQPRFYKLYRNGSYITDVFNTEFFDAGLDAGTFYRYNVYSVDNAGNLSEQPATVSLTTPADFSVSRIRDVEIAGRHSVQIKFSQPLSRLTAETVSNYSLYPSGSVNSAVLDADEKTVILNVSELQTGMSYYVTVRNLTDQSVTPVPLIRVDSPRFVILKDWFDDFESSTFSSYQFLNPDRWNIIPQGKDRALVLESTSFDSPGGKRLGEYMIIPHSIFYSTRFYLRCHVSSLEDLLSNAHADYAVVFAYEDAFNYWYVQVHTYNVAVNHIENGERVLFQEYPLTVNLDQEHRFDLAFYNGELKAAVNKKLCFSLSLSLPAGQLGLGSYNDAVAFDNLNLQADRPWTLPLLLLPVVFMRKLGKADSRVLCLTQDIRSIGGIGNFFRHLVPKFTLPVDLMITGKRLGQSGLFRNVLRFVGDIIRFNQKLSRNSIVLINTSMRFKSVMRDMLFVHVCRVRRKKAVVFIHGWDWSFVNKMQQLAPGFIRFALLKTEAVIVLASEFESALCKQGFKGKVYRLSTFVNDDETADWDEQRIRETAGSPGLRILFMARLEPGKGLFPALDAVKQLQYSHPDVQLNVAGIGSQLTAAQQHAQTQSVPARFHGFVQGEDKKRLMQKADVLLLPTTYGEGMPTAVLEGMAFGCAVVTCPAGGIKDFFQHGKMGFLCDEPHPDILCSYLKQLTDDQALRIRMGLFNFDYVKQHFTADRVLNQLESILRQTGQSKTTERL